MSFVRMQQTAFAKGGYMRHAADFLRGAPALLLLVAIGPLFAAPAEESAWAALRQGGMVLFRHANAPGYGDPPGFQLDDCTTQRNLDARGRAQARRIGERFRAQGVAVGAVISSQWCRARETADIAFPGPVREDAAFNSFFDDRPSEPAQSAAARALLSSWQGPGALVVVTHQVNITALTGVSPASGEAVVLRSVGSRLEVIGRISF